MLMAGVLTAAVLVVALPPPPRRRLAHLRSVDGDPADGAWMNRLRDADILTSPWLASIGAATTVLLFVSGPVGVVVAIAGGILAHRWVSGLESLAARRRRQILARDLPIGADLLVAALSAGRPPEHALATVAGAIGGPLGGEMVAIAARLELGADPVEVWATVARDPVLEPLGRAFGRAAQSGASVTTVLARCVEDLRRRRHTDATRVARSAGVRTAAPLGMCFLPAFIAVGVVPTIVGAFWGLVL